MLSNINAKRKFKNLYQGGRKVKGSFIEIGNSEGDEVEEVDSDDFFMKYNNKRSHFDKEDEKDSEEEEEEENNFDESEEEDGEAEDELRLFVAPPKQKTGLITRSKKKEKKKPGRKPKNKKEMPLKENNNKKLKANEKKVDGAAVNYPGNFFENMANFFNLMPRQPPNNSNTENLESMINDLYNHLSAKMNRIHKDVISKITELQQSINERLSFIILQNKVNPSQHESVIKRVPIITEEDKKKEAILLANKTSNRNAAEEYNVSETTIRRWRNVILGKIKELPPHEKIEALEKFKRNNKQYVRKKKSAKFVLMEEALIKFIQARREKLLPVNMKTIKKKALELIKNYYPGEKFNASNGWFTRFIQRSKLSKRVATHRLQTLCPNYKEEVKNYLKEIYEWRKKMEADNKKVIFINMDQTPIYFDMSSKKTYDIKGKKSIEIKTTTGTNQRCTFMTTITSEGHRLPSYVIFKTRNKLPIKNDYPHHTIIRSNYSGWVTENYLEDWVDRVLLNFIVDKNTVMALFLDQFRIHLKDNIQSKIKAGNIKIFYIPPGCTGLLQPLDVSINKPFKNYLKEEFDPWFDSHGISDENLTKSGNFFPPTKLKIVEWGLNAWTKISKESIKLSFKVCGINNALDGSENDLINKRILANIDIEKRDGVIPYVPIKSSQELVSSSMAKVNITQSAESQDIFSAMRFKNEIEDNSPSHRDYEEELNSIGDLYDKPSEKEKPSMVINTEKPFYSDEEIVNMEESIHFGSLKVNIGDLSIIPEEKDPFPEISSFLNGHMKYPINRKINIPVDISINLDEEVAPENVTNQPTNSQRNELTLTNMKIEFNHASSSQDTQQKLINSAEKNKDLSLNSDNVGAANKINDGSRIEAETSISIPKNMKGFMIDNKFVSVKRREILLKK